MQSPSQIVKGAVLPPPFFFRLIICITSSSSHGFWQVALLSYSHSKHRLHFIMSLFKCCPQNRLQVHSTMDYQGLNLQWIWRIPGRNFSTQGGVLSVSFLSCITQILAWINMYQDNGAVNKIFHCSNHVLFKNASHILLIWRALDILYRIFNCVKSLKDLVQKFRKGIFLSSRYKTPS